MRTFLRAGWHGLRRAVAGPDYPPIATPVRPAWAISLAAFGLIVLALLTQQILVSDRRLPALTAVAIAALVVAPLAFLLRRPLVAWRLMILGELFGTFNLAPDSGWPWPPTQVMIIIVVLLVGAARVDRSVLVWLGLCSLIPVWIFVSVGNRAGVTLLYVFLLIVGDLLGRNLRARRALAEQEKVSEQEKAHRAVLEERARIARELHDVVAHHMSMIAVQAETAPYRLGELPEPAREEFTAIAGTARAALTDMRRLLGVLRSADTEPLKAPQPGLADIPDLVETARRAGMDAELDVAAGPRPPEAVGLAAYRIAQEALANASRHAPGAPVRVELRPWREQLFLRVHNGSPAGPPPAEPARPTRPGHGLAGMRERAALLGGEFTAGPDADGGYEVQARLPYDGAES